ncbi:MAG TPA: hypothetical protein VG986_18480 [Pseudolabrys sp.]|nr:hypothetical protein [Pseudolabrys sp.]
MRRLLSAFLFGVLASATPVLAAEAATVESKVPSALTQEILVKTTLLTLNDANVTGNYTVLHAKLAKPFREQFNADRLKQIFKSFAEQNIDWQMIAAKSPVSTAEPAIDKRGALLLRGYFDTAPSRLSYDLDFLPSEGEWKPIKLNVKVKPPGEN